jgi:hypothetical protein
MLRPATFILVSGALCLIPAAPIGAQGQVPPHSPGTICFTPYFWCWAQPPGPPGSPCACPSAYGWVNGVRG